MNNTAFEQIIDDFQILDDWEDRYRYIIDLGKKSAPFDENKRNDNNKVMGCASQVWLDYEFKIVENKTIFCLSGDSDALIVKGLVEILVKLYDGIELKQASNIDAASQFSRLKLTEHLSSQRSNGLNSMLKLIGQALLNKNKTKL